jgi:type II secretory pathway pseudopilin PulG
MDALRRAGGLTIAAMIAIVALAIVFWMLLISPQREEAARLGDQIATVEASLASHRAEVRAGEAARRRFPVDYGRLVVLGKAVPGGDETASLLVQLNGMADSSSVKFDDLELNSRGGGSGEEAASVSSSPGGTPVSATEAAASLLPLGASIGPAGLAVMPYTLTFEGSFFQIADFIERLDAMVKTQNEKVTVDGRLITVNGFSLTAEGEGEGAKSSSGASPTLTATFEVTTYLTPPSQGATAGATPSGPAESTATPAAATTGGAP